MPRGGAAGVAAGGGGSSGGGGGVSPGPVAHTAGRDQAGEEGAAAAQVELWPQGQHLPLPAAQLLACQPHRLLAAACALAAALPDKLAPLQASLVFGIGRRVATMAKHRTLSEWVRNWMTTQPAELRAAAAAGGDSGVWHVSHDACVGCLAALLQSAVRYGLASEPGQAASFAVTGLLRIAAATPPRRPGVPCCVGCDKCEPFDERYGGFPQFAGVSRCVLDNPFCRFAQAIHLADGTSIAQVLLEALGPDGRPPPPPPPPAALPASRPPPLALPASMAAALPRLRVCGGPGCGNFLGVCEAALPFKKCGGCRAVRYCGADCQRAHWREGHKAECKAFAAVAEDGE